MRVLRRWAIIGGVAILGFMARPSAAGTDPLAGVTFGSQNLTGAGSTYSGLGTFV